MAPRARAPLRNSRFGLRDGPQAEVLLGCRTLQSGRWRSCVSTVNSVENAERRIVGSGCAPWPLASESENDQAHDPWFRAAGNSSGRDRLYAHTLSKGS